MLRIVGYQDTSRRLASKRVLYITYDGVTDPLGNSQAFRYLKGLSKEHTIHLISFEKKHRYNSQGKKLVEECNQHNIVWHPFIYTESPPVLSTIFDIIRGYQKGKKIVRKYRINIIHCRGYISSFIGLRLKKKLNSKMIFDMRGWFAEEKVESGAWSSSVYKPIFNYFKKEEKKYIEKSDYTVSLTEAGKNYILKSFRINVNNIGVIPTCTDLNQFKFDTNNRKLIRKELNIKDSTKVLIHSGGLGGHYKASKFIQLYKEFKKHFDDTVFLVLSKDGIGLDLAELKKEIIVTSAHYTEVQKYLSAADYGLIYYPNTFSVIGRSPTKLGEYLGCGVFPIGPQYCGDLELQAKTLELPISLYKDDLNMNIIDKKYDKEKLREKAYKIMDLELGVKFYHSLYLQL